MEALRTADVSSIKLVRYFRRGEPALHPASRDSHGHGQSPRRLSVAGHARDTISHPGETAGSAKLPDIVSSSYPASACFHLLVSQLQARVSASKHVPTSSLLEVMQSRLSGSDGGCAPTAYLGCELARIVLMPQCLWRAGEQIVRRRDFYAAYVLDAL